MTGFSAVQRAELSAAWAQSERDAQAESRRLRGLAGVAGPGTEAATVAVMSAASAVDSLTETLGSVEGSPGSASLADCELLLLAEAQPVILRIAAATDSDFPGRVDHIARVAALAVRCRMRPTNSFAKATL